MPAGTFYNATKKQPRRRQPKINKQTKKYVDKKIAKSEWSKQIYTTIDFDVTGLGTDNKYLLTALLCQQLINNNYALMSGGSVAYNTDGTVDYSVDIKIDYVKWQLRYALGENEETSAVSQTVREIFFRTDQQIDEVISSVANITSLCDDLDGNIKYAHAYGNKKGIFSDKMFYLASQAADSDTTVGGQYISKGFKTLKYSDSYSIKEGQAVANMTSEKGQLSLELFADNPSGENCNVYGYVEIGWRYKTDS